MLSCTKRFRFTLSTASNLSYCLSFLLFKLIPTPRFFYQPAEAPRGRLEVVQRATASRRALTPGTNRASKMVSRSVAFPPTATTAKSCWANMVCPVCCCHISVLHGSFFTGWPTPQFLVRSGSLKSVHSCVICTLGPAGDRFSVAQACFLQVFR